MTIISRAVPIPEVEGRTLIGRAYSYGLPASVTDDGGASRYFEQILHGADTKSIADRAGGTFPLLIWHSQDANRGHFPTDEIGEVTFHPTEEGLDYTAVVSRGRLGDEMLELAKDGTAEDVSMTYRPLRNIEGVFEGHPLVSRAEIALKELSLCPTGTGQHEGAKVLVMRATTVVPDLADLDARLRLLNLF
jgi:phage head maturation protease